MHLKGMLVMAMCVFEVLPKIDQFIFKVPLQVFIKTPKIICAHLEVLGFFFIMFP